MSDIESDHPRAESLRTREKLAQSFEKGLVTPEGLSAHGRGEAFDYILGEETTKQAERAIEAVAARLLSSENPVISVNGNVAALVPEEIGELSRVGDMLVEVNLFHRSEERKRKIAEYLMESGVDEVLGMEEGYLSEIEGIESNRRVVDERGIGSADTVLVPLEDGDRTEPLEEAGKTVVTIDLNPMSRTAEASDVTIVDNIVRTMPLLVEKVQELKSHSEGDLSEIAEGFDNWENLSEMLKLMLNRLERLSCR